MKVFKKNYLIILFQKFIKKIKMILYQILDYNSENLNNEDDSFSDDDKLNTSESNNSKDNSN